MQRPRRERPFPPPICIPTRWPAPWLAVLLTLAAALLLPSSASAVETAVEVRVISQGAKFVGSSMGGARITIEDAATGRILAEGVTAGSTGDTARIMGEKADRRAVLSTPGAALFATTLELDGPRRLRFTARGPLAQPQAEQEASVTQWVVPGKPLTGGDGVLLELRGLVVDVLAPPAHSQVRGVPRQVEVRANVTMLCGCPVEPGGLWDADRMEIRARVERDGEPFAEIDLPYAGSSSQFAGSFQADGPGLYTITAYAWDAGNGATGVDMTTVVLRQGE